MALNVFEQVQVTDISQHVLCKSAELLHLYVPNNRVREARKQK